MLIDKITEHDIQTGIQAKDWKDAIRNSSRILLENGSITQNYVDAMIRALDDNGPYIVISKHVALAHTRPEYGAKKTAISFSTMATPVNFGSEMFDPIQLIITLSAVDEDTHLDLMGELTDLLLDGDKMDRLLQATTSKEFYEILKE